MDRLVGADHNHTIGAAVDLPSSGNAFTQAHLRLECQPDDPSGVNTAALNLVDGVESIERDLMG